MKLSKRGLELIKRFESCRLTAYKAVNTEEFFTIGFGHYGEDVKEDSKITLKEAENILKKDVEKFEKGVNSLLKTLVNQNQFDSLVSFAYNVGLKNLKNSTLLKLVNERKFNSASMEFSKWNKSGGTVLLGLVRRRKAEQELFQKEVEKKKEKSLITYKIKNGDTLEKIAKDHRSSVDELLKFNKSIKDKDKIQAGKVIYVPR